MVVVVVVCNLDIFENAYGIDVNPGLDNPFVRFGDFNKLDVPDGSVDFVAARELLP